MSLNHSLKSITSLAVLGKLGRFLFNEYLVKGQGIVVAKKGTAGAVVWVEDNFNPIDTSFCVKDKLNVNFLFLHYFLLLRSNFKDVESFSPGYSGYF